MKILDCTLRDGGYYNSWDFHTEVYESYLKAMSESRIDFVELGLRNFKKPDFLGAFAYTTEDFLSSIELPEGPIYGVMVDAKTILNSGKSVEKAIDELFCPESDSKLGLVRVAAHFKEVEFCGEIVKHLKELGYRVGFNLMQAGGKESSVISQMAAIASSWGSLDVLYFADSLGNMDSTEVERIVVALREEWSGELGIHTHDNMGKGLENSMCAKGLGVTWLDSTVTGMGRGAGNTQTEYLLAKLSEQPCKYINGPVFELVIRHFEPMQKEYGWGSNLLYFLGAQNEVHPTFIQNLLSSSHFGVGEVIGAIDYLSKLDGSASYCDDILNTALSFSNSSSEPSGTDALAGMFKGKEVLIIANGPSFKRYLKDIEHYIRINRPVVLSLNLNFDISEDLIDYFIISHNPKILSEFNKYGSVKKPLVLPKHRFSEQEIDSLNNIEIFDFGMQVEKSTFKIEAASSVVPYDVTAAYALAISVAGKAEAINLVGFDGFEPGDLRQQEMVDIFMLYANNNFKPSITSLTPTTYNVHKGSIYAPS